MQKNVEIIFSEEARNVFDTLLKTESKEARMLVKSIEQKLSLIKINPLYGNPIAKNLIPWQYKEREIDNLFKVELPAFWRMLYALQNDEQQIKIIGFIVGILNHDDYNKKFGYRKN